MNWISIQILENGGLWSISSRLLFSLTYAGYANISENSLYWNRWCQKRRRERQQIWAQPHIWERCHAMVILLVLSFCTKLRNWLRLVFNRLLLRSSGVSDFMTLLYFLSCFGLTLPGFHTSSDMYELSKSICWNHLQPKSVIFVVDCRLDNRLPWYL